VGSEVLDRQTARAIGNHYVRVTGEVENRSDRVVEEMEVEVHYLDAAGAPRRVDPGFEGPGRPTFNRCWPVLVQSAWAGEQARSLPPGGKRKFVVDVPLSFEEPTAEGPAPFGARLTALRLR
jgi:hypothetical protein